jgi:hypothetical protein
MAVKNSSFFDLFPKIDYDINNVLASSTGPHETVTDIFFRFGILKRILTDVTSYYVYELDDTDTPEILAEKVYGDSGAGWMIIYANQIVDPLFDWPLNYDAFNKMIADKYGSVEYAQTNVHHCEKVIKRYNTFYKETTESRFVIDNIRQSQNLPDVPYSYYTPYTVTTHRTSDSSVFTGDDAEVPFLTADLEYDDTVNVSKTGSVAHANEVNTYTVDGKTIVETISGESISFYDHEARLNDQKRQIKVIKTDYYSTIQKEFKAMVTPPSAIVTVM